LARSGENTRKINNVTDVNIPKNNSHKPDNYDLQHDNYESLNFNNDPINIGNYSQDKINKSIFNYNSK
jgi:hypothetical protein